MAMGTQTTVPLRSLKNAADSMGVAPATTAGIKVDRINFPTGACGPSASLKELNFLYQWIRNWE